MGTKEAAVTERAWRLLRLALVWARKGGALGRSLLYGGKFLNGLGCGGGDLIINDDFQIPHGYKELSFGESPMFRRLGRKRSGYIQFISRNIACVNPPSPACSLGFEGDEWYAENSREAFFRRNSSETVDGNGEEGFSSVEWLEGVQEVSVMVEEDQQRKDDVDARAEEFIARFRRQLKLQRQVSLLEYHQMLNRGI